MTRDADDPNALSRNASLPTPLAGMARQIVILTDAAAANTYLQGGGATMEWQENGELKSISTDTPEGTAIAGQVALAQIRSRMIMRIGLYTLAGFLFVVAAIIVVFAPDGREQTSVIMAAALFVVAVGCAGFSTFALKAPLVSATAGR